MLLIIEAPLRLFLTLTIPVVDYEKTPGRSWNRLLIMCNILLGPAFATFAFEGTEICMKSHQINIYKR